MYLTNVVHSFDKSASVRREREARERAAEEAQLEALVRAQREKELRARVAAEEEALVDALETKKKEAPRRELMVRKVADGDPALRELKEKLRAAEVNLERDLQREEKLLIAEREEALDAATHAVAEQQRIKAMYAEERANAARQASIAKSRVVLAEQIEEKKRMQAAAKEEYLKERDVVDALAARIREEDEAELMRKAQKVKDTKTWVAKFLAMREEAREVERQRLREEEAQIRRFAEEIARREEAAASMGAAKREEADRILERLTREKEENDRKREEMEELINRLYFEEQEEKFRLAKQQKAAKAQAALAEMKAENENQKAVKAAMRARDEAEEEEFRRVMLERFAEQDRIEQMNAQKRRMKMQEHKREVERLASVKRAMYEEQMAREVEAEEAAAAEERAQAAIVEEERKRLLVEHAARLKDYLPKGVLAAPEDLDLINTVTGRLDEMSATGTMGRAGTRAAGSKAFAM